MQFGALSGSFQSLFYREDVISSFREQVPLISGECIIASPKCIVFQCSTPTFTSSREFQVVSLSLTIFEGEGESFKQLQSFLERKQIKEARKFQRDLLRYTRKRLLQQWCRVLLSPTHFVMYSWTSRLRSGVICSPGVTNWTDFFPSALETFWMILKVTTCLESLTVSQWEQYLR